MPEKREKSMGRDALPRVRIRNPKPDAEHRVPTGARPYPRWNFFKASDPTTVPHRGDRLSIQFED